MGKFLNPGNEAFARIVNSDYVDKTGVIEVINNTINTAFSLTCLSRPRRFGKSFMAHMLCAYYDCSCDSHCIFDRYDISSSETYEQYINQYNVIVIDVTGFISDVKQSADAAKMFNVPQMISSDLRNDIIAMYPELSSCSKLEDCLLQLVKITGRKIIFIIDEWDAPVREAYNDVKTQDSYFAFLRGLFKNSNVTPYVVAAAYMTGILPIKKDGSQSAISDFEEYTILDPSAFTQYTGFTEQEVRDLCSKNDMSFEEAERWYDGYCINGISIYNPYSVMTAMKRKKYRSYWTYTSAADSLEAYINMNFEGLHEDVLRLIAGEAIEVKTNGFKNDLISFGSKDDILTLMIHLGYLTYDEEHGIIRIPNEELRTEFVRLLECRGASHFTELVKSSGKLLEDTLAGDEAAVVEAIEHIRQSNYAPSFYNNEQALRYVIKFAYVICIDRYMKVEELPSGTGIADVVYIPKRNVPDPALVIELKWNKTGEAAIGQIKRRNYPAVLDGFGGEIVLVGINYDAKTKVHSCKIERIG